MDQRRDSSNTHKGMEQRATCIGKTDGKTSCIKTVGSKRLRQERTQEEVKKKKGTKMRGAEGKSKVSNT